MKQPIMSATQPTQTKKKNTKRNTKKKRKTDASCKKSQTPWSIPICSEDEVLKLIQDINVNKSSGLTHLNNKSLKSVLKVLSSQFTFIFNSSIETGYFPNSWKDALVIPIPKSGDLSSVTNFRPISILPQPGKIMEKLVHDKLTHYIECNELL